MRLQTTLPPRVGFCIASLLLALVLSACSGGGSNGSATPTPILTRTSTPTPLPPLSPTPFLASGLTTYTGKGYTIGYPQHWNVSTSREGIVTFTDPQGVVYLNVKVTPNPTGAVSASNQVTLALQAIKTQTRNYQKVDSPPTASVGGETWSQGAATGDMTVPGQSSSLPGKVVVIADNHPAHAVTTNSFIIAYATAHQFFDLLDSAYFQPMLRSFTFT
ncbi:MAG: hypothetical protein M3Y76_07795 [Chloroflexota bacterium]|nr:hypothetical protein [Chloroflexota bacterium]